MNKSTTSQHTRLSYNTNFSNHKGGRNGKITADELMEVHQISDNSLSASNGNATNKYEGSRQVCGPEDTVDRFNQISIEEPMPLNRFDQFLVEEPSSENRFDQSSVAESLPPRSLSFKASGLLRGRQTTSNSMAFYPVASQEFELALDTESLHSSILETVKELEPRKRNSPDLRSQRLLKRHSISECWTTPRLPEIDFQNSSRLTSRNSYPEPLNEFLFRNQGSISLTKPSRRMSLTHNERNFESLPTINGNCRKENNFSIHKSQQLSFHLAKAEQDYDRNKSKADVLLHWLSTQQPC